MPITAQDPTLDETTLVQDAQSGDLKAFDTLVSRYLTIIRCFVAQRTPTTHLVDELTQETFVLAYDRLDQFTPGTSLRSWLQAIAWQMLRKEILRYSREQANRKRFAAHWASIASEGWKGDDERLDHLRRCLEALPSKQRDLLDRKYRHGESANEIATAVGQTAEWVRTNLYRLRTRLRECVERRRTS